MNMTRDELEYRAKLNSVEQRFGVLKYVLPLGVCATPMLFAIGGQAAVACAGLLGMGLLSLAWKGSERDWHKIDAGNKETLKKRTNERDRPALDKLYAETPPPPAEPAQKPAIAKTWQPITFDAQALLDRGTCILLMGDPGSGKSTLASQIVNTRNAPLLVLDPHFDPDSNPWGNSRIIDDKKEIFYALEYLITLIDKKDNRPLTVMLDEIPSLRVYGDDKKENAAYQAILQRFILKWATEGRKFNKVAILGAQIGNVEGFGLKGMGDFLSCFSRIRLGGIAKTRAQNHPHRELRQWLNNHAYVLTIDENDAALHPNLGHHAVVKNGSTPINMTPVACPPLPADILAGVHHPTSPAIPPPPSKPHHTGHHTHHTPDITPNHTAITPPHPPSSHPSHTPGNRPCPECGSIQTVKNGTYRDGRQRRRCKKCEHEWAVEPS